MAEDSSSSLSPVLSTIINFFNRFASSLTPEEEPEVKRLVNTAETLQPEKKTPMQLPTEIQHMLRKDEELKKKIQKHKKIQQGSSTFYIVEGDILFTEEQYQKYLDLQRAMDDMRKKGIEPAYASAVSLLGMIDNQQRFIRWAPQAARNLTYSIDYASFKGMTPTAEDVHKYMLYAAVAWNSVCGVNICEVPATANPVFRVAYNHAVVEDGLMAFAFFPDSPVDQRVLWICRDFSRTGFDMPGILKHELGHILGFRHEHIRALPYNPEDPTDNTVGITNYDSKSIMHYYYPPYGGSKDGTITGLDIEGAMFYYGPPLHKFSEHHATLL